MLPKIICKFEHKVTPSFPLEYLGEKQEKQCRYVRDTEGLSGNHCCSVENSITYSDCGCAAVGIEHAKRMRHIVVCGLSSSTIFLHISYKWHDFREKVIDGRKCVLIFSTNLPEIYPIVIIIKRDSITSFYRSSCKVPVIFVRFEWKLNFLDRISKHAEISNFMNIRPVWTELYQADRRTDRHYEA